VAEAQHYDLSGPNGPVVFRELPEGVRVRLTDGAMGEVVGNPGDGAFVLVKILENADDPSRVGQQETVFFLDVKGVE
jgi:hypothetical protein